MFSMAEPDYSGVNITMWLICSKLELKFSCNLPSPVRILVPLASDLSFHDLEA